MAEDAVGDGSPEHGQLAGEGDFGDSADDVPLPYRGLDEALHLIDEDDEDDDEDDDEEAEDVDAAGVGGGTAPKRSRLFTLTTTRISHRAAASEELEGYPLQPPG